GGGREPAVAAAVGAAPGRGDGNLQRGRGPGGGRPGQRRRRTGPGRPGGGARGRPPGGRLPRRDERRHPVHARPLPRPPRAGWARRDAGYRTVMSLAGHDSSLSISENYLAFAREARGRSRPYEILAAQVAADPSVLAFLAALPPAKQQPNLLFAAARYLLGRP